MISNENRANVWIGSFYLYIYNFIRLVKKKKKRISASRYHSEYVSPPRVREGHVVIVVVTASWHDWVRSAAETLLPPVRGGGGGGTGQRRRRRNVT